MAVRLGEKGHDAMATLPEDMGAAVGGEETVPVRYLWLSVALNTLALEAIYWRHGRDTGETLPRELTPQEYHALDALARDALHRWLLDVMHRIMDRRRRGIPGGRPVGDEAPETLPERYRLWLIAHHVLTA
jgi:hypothetical protein